MWYLFVDDQKVGPLDEEQIQAQILEGRVKRTTLVWRDGWPDWNHLYAVPELNEFFRSNAPASEAAQTPEADDDAMKTLVFGQALNIELPDARPPVPASASAVAEPGTKAPADDSVVSSSASSQNRYIYLGAAVMLLAMATYVLSLNDNGTPETIAAVEVSTGRTLHRSAALASPTPTIKEMSGGPKANSDDEKESGMRARKMVILEPWRPSATSVNSNETSQSDSLPGSTTSAQAAMAAEAINRTLGSQPRTRLTQNYIDQVVKRDAAKLRACAQNGPGSKMHTGRAVLLIEADGMVRNVELSIKDSVPDQVVQCLKNVLKALRFDTSRGQAKRASIDLEF